jgi:ubiquinone/menaquinone biosynthesis C-methylase UbiE
VKRCLLIGTINKYTAPRGWEYVHVDLSDRPIYDVATGREARIDVVADMRDLPFEDESADRVQCWHALEHVNEAGGRRAVGEFFRVLRPGGVLDVQVPDIGGVAGARDIEALLPYIYGQQFEMEDAELNVHRWGYTDESLRRVLADAGFGRVEPGGLGDLHLLATKPG